MPLTLSQPASQNAAKVAGSRISLRIASPLWLHPERCEDVLRVVTEYRDCIEEVAFFTASTHSPLPLAVIEERAALLAKILPRFRAAGLTAGINHLTTIGHLDEALSHSLTEPWQHLVDADGAVTKGSYCPRDPDVRRYVVQSYAALAAAAPDFIWLDDDIRMGGHPPAGLTCFCERCLGIFAGNTGLAWTRESLRQAFNAEDQTKRLALRGQWLAHNRETMNQLFADIRGAVDEIDPQMVLGWMSCELFYEGFDYDNWFATLAGPREVATKARPGGGFYWDNSPGDMLWKAHSIGWQTALIPESVTDIQSEHENFPYQMLRKSAHTFGTEIGVYIGAGCTGTALNLMGISNDPIEEYLPLFQRVREWRPFYDAAATAFGRSVNEGVWAAYSKDLFAVKGLEADWFKAPYAAGSWETIREWAEIGFPSAYHRDGAAVTLLGGDTPLAFAPEQLLEILSGGVVLDGAAAIRLHEMGLGHLVGFQAREARGVDAVELFSADELNSRFSGCRRDTRPSFWKTGSYLLEPVIGDTRVLSDLADLQGEVLGTASGIFENALGGRIATLGYAPWSLFHTLAKSSQLKVLLRWLSRDQLPAFVGSYHRAALWCRRNSDEQRTILLLNNSLDPAAGLRLHVRGNRTYRVTRPGEEAEEARVVGQDGPYMVLELPVLGPWEMALIS